jgi:hypothetical protein
LKSTKLIKLLKTFTETEIKKFRDFVKSPYHNKNQNIIKLYEAIVKFYPSYESDLLTEKYIYSKVFGSIQFDYFKIKNLTSDLYNLGLEFFRLQPNNMTSFDRDYNLLVELRHRRLWGYHRKMVKAIEKQFSDITIKDDRFLYNNYLLTMESHLSNVLEKPNSIERIQDEYESFYEYSVLNLLKFYSLMMHITKENKVNIDMKMFNEVITYIEKNPVSSNPTIIAYKYIVLLSSSRKEEYYFLLKKHYFDNFEKMSYEDAYYINMYIVGYATDMYNLNADYRFIQECFDLLKHAYLNDRVTLGELLYPNFINYVKVFTRAGHTELARNFISELKVKLPGDQLENCLNFSNAFIAHKEGRLDEALKLAVKVKFPWFIMKIQSKVLLVQLNYELGNFEETRELIESFKKTLTKEGGISEDYKVSISGFLRLTITLINIAQETEKRKKEYEASRLLELVEGSQPNHFGIKFWLTEQTGRLGVKSQKKIIQESN